jgi:hypothetical protein
MVARESVAKLNPVVAAHLRDLREPLLKGVVNILFPGSRELAAFNKIESAADMPNDVLKRVKQGRTSLTPDQIESLNRLLGEKERQDSDVASIRAALGDLAVLGPPSDAQLRDWTCNSVGSLANGACDASSDSLNALAPVPPPLPLEVYPLRGVPPLPLPLPGPANHAVLHIGGLLVTLVPGGRLVIRVKDDGSAVMTIPTIPPSNG